MRFAALGPVRRGAARLLLTPLGSLPQWKKSSTGPSASKRLTASPGWPHYGHGASFRLCRFGSQPHSGASKTSPDPHGVFAFQDKQLKNRKVSTNNLSSHFCKHRPVVLIKLYGDETETAVVQESFQVAQSSALVALVRNRKNKIAFQHPLDLTMWVINSFSECEIAVGSEMRVASEFRINLDIHNSALLSEYCLIEFGGAVPPKMERLFKKMKCYTTNKGYSLITDPSLIAAHLWSSAFLDTFHMIFHEMPETERSSFLRKLDACCQGWHKEMIANKLLKYFVTYSHPDGTLANRDKNSSKAFLECIRHILSHPLDYLKMMERLGLGSYTKEDLHLLLQEKGGDKLMSDIWDILAEDHKERLKKLSLERYLCRMGSSCCPLPTICVRRSFKDEPSRFDPYTSTYLKRIYDQRINQEKLFLEPPVLRKWKIEYAKNRLSAIEGFWSMFASLGEYSIWICVREDDVECQKHATKNTVCALMQKMSACRAYSFGKMVVLGTSSGPFKMKGFWVFPKASVPSFLMEIHGMSCYGWTRVNTSLEKEKDFVDSVLNENIPNEGPVVAASYL